jgi:hypothetical protein
MIGEGIAFVAVRHRSLRAAGLGRLAVTVRIAGDRLTFEGDEGQRLELSVAAIRRVRFGYEIYKTGGRGYQMMVWTDATPRPLLLRVMRVDQGAFGAAAREIAAQVAMRRGQSSVEGGLDWFSASVNGIMFVPFVVLSTSFTISALKEGVPLPYMIAVPAVLIMVLAILGYSFFSKDCPRSLDVAAFVPPVAPQQA